MKSGEMVLGIFFLALAAGAFAVSYFQFKEKGYLLNNAYLWASREERRRMDKNKETKRPYYRQSGVTFMLIGIICLMDATYAATGWGWVYAAFWAAVVITVAYAVVSTIQIERRK